MTFQDIFKSKFLEQAASITALDMLLGMGLAFLLGLFIFFVYQKTYTGVMVSASFGLTLIGLTMVTTLVILAVTSNIVLSLGMVGALSIVRFRTAIKDPLDIVFLFWSIAVGIVLAAGLIPLAVFGSAMIGLMLLFFARRRATDSPYILVLRCDGAEAEQRAREMLTASVKKAILKSKSVTEGQTELNFEVRLQEDDSLFIDLLAESPGVSDVLLVSYQGDYVG